MPVLAVTHPLTLGALIAVMVVFGALSLVNDAALQAFVPRLVPAGLLTPAHSPLDQSDAVAQTSGPAFAGGLVPLWGRGGRCSSTPSVAWCPGPLTARVELRGTRIPPYEVRPGTRLRHPDYRRGW